MSEPKPGRHHPRNTLNDLTGRDWLVFTRTWFAQEAERPDLTPDTAEALRRYAEALLAETGPDQLGDLRPAEWLDHATSWFIADSRRYYRNKPTELHPARYPEEMVARFVRFFTQQGRWVLDPFAGSGATLVTCLETSRHAVGVELNPRYAEAARYQLPLSDTTGTVITGNIRQMAQPGFWDAAIEGGCPVVDGLPQFDFVMTSPPYWNMLRHSRGNVLSTHQERAERGLDTHYSEASDDLGNTAEYGDFVEALGAVFDDVGRLLRPGCYLVIVIQNLRDRSGEVRPLAWDLARRVSRTLSFQGERIWCQNTKKLGIWGYPKVFVPNYHHHYCLIFRRPVEG